MPITYQRARPETSELLDAVRKRYHPVLDACGVTTDILATAGLDKEGNVEPSLKQYGYHAYAVMKIQGLKERALGMADTLLIIDEAKWSGLTTSEQEALLDHELTHLEVKSKDGGLVQMTDGELDTLPKLDDAGRPVLIMRLHDWQFGGFREVAERHGAHAPEVRYVEQCKDEGGKYWWEGGEE